MREKLNNLMKEFLYDCEDISKARGQKESIKPTFSNFIRWLDYRTTWEMD